MLKGRSHTRSCEPGGGECDGRVKSAVEMRRELVLWDGCVYALDGRGAPSRLSEMRRAAALASSSPTLVAYLSMQPFTEAIILYRGLIT